MFSFELQSARSASTQRAEHFLAKSTYYVCIRRMSPSPATSKLWILYLTNFHQNQNISKQKGTVNSQSQSLYISALRLYINFVWHGGGRWRGAQFEKSDPTN